MDYNNDHNIVSCSGGKDSTATLLLALERNVENLRAVFADTGNEHEITYEYVRYLEQETGVKIEWVTANFDDRIANKRAFIKEKWSNDGISDEHIREALEVLQPTGNPFLDMCLWKGRFPSTRVRFCTQELKVFPIREQILKPLLADHRTADVISWQGVRADESPARAKLPVEDEDDIGVINYRPILDWTAEMVFDFHRKHNVKWNPLYENGCGRVGCMPCVNVRKKELRNIAKRFPEEIARLEHWEDLVSRAAKRGSSTFIPAVAFLGKDPDEDVHYSQHGIARAVEWSNTSHGGKQIDLIAAADDGKSCDSAYGLCE